MKLKKEYLRYLVVCAGIIVLASGFVFMHFGGFDTGKSLDVSEMQYYAKPIESILIPDNARIIALGEATHGNKEFQKLKLDVFKLLVEKYGVKGFVLEGDFGGCEEVNAYIHGGTGTAEEAVKKIGFQIYKTEEMMHLLEYMKAYNKNANEGEDLRFYGMDMQRQTYSLEALKQECSKYGIDTTFAEEPLDAEHLLKLKGSLEMYNADSKCIQYTDVLLQNLDIMSASEAKGALKRDAYMAENVEWALQQERDRGYNRIFISGHNEHVAKWGSYVSMGKLLSEKEDYGYYVIGTDFYKTRCNLSLSKNKRTVQTFYSHDPVAKTAMLAGFSECWLDFSTLDETTELSQCVQNYTYLGTLGDSYSFIQRLLPPSYRMFQPPATLYDSMIYISEASPTKIRQ